MANVSALGSKHVAWQRTSYGELLYTLEDVCRALVAVEREGERLKGALMEGQWTLSTDRLRELRDEGYKWVGYLYLFQPFHPYTLDIWVHTHSSFCSASSKWKMR